MTDMNTRGEPPGAGSRIAGPYPPEFKDEMVRLARNGRSARSLAREFAPTEQTIRRWVRRADLDEGRGGDGLTTSERKELLRLRQDNSRLKMERNILRKAVVWFARGNRGSQAVPGRARGGPN